LGDGLNRNFPEMFLFAELAKDVTTDLCQRGGFLLLKADVPRELEEVQTSVHQVSLKSLNKEVK
jgi:hypothetical protein